MKKIILDTNFLISLIKFKISLEEIHSLLSESYEIHTLHSVVNELKNLSKRNKYAKTALKLLETMNIRLIKSRERNVDEAILAAIDKDTIVATNDIKLRKKVKELGAKIIYLRAIKHLGIG